MLAIWARFGRTATCAYRLGAAGALVAMECMLVCVRVALSVRSLDHRAVRTTVISCELKSVTGQRESCSCHVVVVRVARVFLTSPTLLYTIVHVVDRGFEFETTLC